LSRIYRPKFYRYWSKNKGFTHVLTGICTENVLTYNLIGVCPEKFFRPYFLLSGKKFSPPSRSPTFLGKIVARNKNLLQGIISFSRAILADTPRIKRG
jgi:hypothetical protein